MTEIGRKERSNLWKIIFVSIFSRLGLFPHVFGKMKQWLTLQLHEMETVLHVVAFLLDFYLLVIDSSREEFSNL